MFLERLERPTPAERDEAGFLTGLEGGWDALRNGAVILATILGAMLPFTVVLLLLGVPAWLVGRSLLRRRRPEPLPAE